MALSSALSALSGSSCSTVQGGRTRWVQSILPKFSLLHCLAGTDFSASDRKLICVKERIKWQGRFNSVSKTDKSRRDCSGGWSVTCSLEEKIHVSFIVKHVCCHASSRFCQNFSNNSCFHNSETLGRPSKMWEIWCDIPSNYSSKEAMWKEVLISEINGYFALLALSEYAFNHMPVFSLMSHHKYFLGEFGAKNVRK